MNTQVAAILRLVLALVVSGLGLWYAGRQIDLQVIITDLGKIEFWHVSLAVGCVVFALGLRAYRWHQVLLREKEFGFSNTFWANAIGYLGNSILPARAGEVLRSVVLALAADIRKSMVLATALTERMLDAGILLLMAFVMLQFTAALPPSVARLWSFLLPVVVLLLVAAFAAPLLQNFWLKLVSFVPLSAPARQKLQHMLIGLLDGIRVFHHVRLLFIFLVLSCVIWSVDAAVLSSLASAFGAKLTIPQAVVFAAALGFASSIPSTPGFVGVFQAVAVLVLPVFGIAANKAFLIVTFFQVMFLFVVVALGVPGWIIMRRRLGHARLASELRAPADSEGQA